MTYDPSKLTSTSPIFSAEAGSSSISCTNPMTFGFATATGAASIDSGNVLCDHPASVSICDIATSTPGGSNFSIFLWGFNESSPARNAFQIRNLYRRGNDVAWGVFQNQDDLTISTGSVYRMNSVSHNTFGLNQLAGLIL